MSVKSNNKNNSKNHSKNNNKNNNKNNKLNNLNEDQLKHNKSEYPKTIRSFQQPQRK